MRTRPFRPAVLKVLDLVAISAGFAIAYLAFRTLYPSKFDIFTRKEVLGGFAVSVGSFWVVIRLYDGSFQGRSYGLFDRFFCLGTGVNLIVEAVLNYFQLLTRSGFIIAVGGLIAALLLMLIRMWGGSRPAGTVLIGYDPVAYQLAHALGDPILGVIGERGRQLPYEVPDLGPCSGIEQLMANRRPSRILIASPACLERIPPSLLLKYRLSGVAVDDISALYENVFRRVRLEGSELRWAPSLRADSRTMAVQAIYTNLIGLCLLAALFPLLLLVTIAVALFSGRGAAIQGTEYAGFQNIPFRLLRFRTLRTDGSGAPTAIGRLITRLHLVNLPQLINVVRGEMALFGPRPVRLEFARRLRTLMPASSLRSSVKPGLVGWAQVQLRGDSRVEDEFLQLEYDVYYIKQASPLLDLEILVRLLTGRKASSPPMAGPQQATA
jgi:lipopolysaccharide/colanic/teichoic acid biosynthesis glycosyltransferase